MELRQLEYFMAVAGEMSFSRAAARVNVVQSALSTSVSKLERELGVQLFDRRRHRINLTEAGEAFRDRVGEVLQAADRARESALASAGDIIGTVNLGILISSGPLDFLGALIRFSEQHPQVRLRSHLYQTGSEAYLPALLAGTLDLALVSGPATFPPQLEVHLLFEDPLVFVCSSGHPMSGRRRVDITELAHERLVGFPQESGLRNVVTNAFKAAGIDAPTHHELMLSFPNIARLVERGLVSALVPRSEAEKMTGLTSIELKVPVLWKVYLASWRLREASQATARLADVIMKSPGTIQHRSSAAPG